MDTNKMFIDMARQAREFAEMCCFMQKMPGMPLTAEVKDALDEYAKRLGLLKADPEAWRERNRQKQAAGVKFEWRNEGVWRRGYKGSIFTFDIGGEEDYREVPHEPRPAKLTAKIVREDRWGIVRQQDWEFYGTPEEYRAECEKYGYAVVGEIKEVDKPKTVKHYFCMINTKRV